MNILFQSKLFKVIQKFQKGRSGQQLERHVIEHPGAVTILPVLPDGRVVLIRQFRIAVDQYLIELPAGTLEAGEAPIITASRELVEETGYKAGKIEPLLTFYSSPGILHEVMHLFLATELEPGQTDLEDGEDIELVLADWKEVRRMIYSGEILDAKTLVSLLWYMEKTPGTVS